MTGPPAATAAVRVAVRRSLADLPAAAFVAAAVSGGADSLALAAALAFERPGSRALIVDHGLQEGSAAVAAHAAAQCAGLGLVATVLTTPTEVVVAPESPAAPMERGGGGGERQGGGGRERGGGGGAEQGGAGQEGAASAGAADGAAASGGGPEAAARELRYRLLDGAARDRGLAAILLGHTQDDQAETVLLGLARGSGARSLAGMAAVRPPYRRPLLALDRATTAAACTQAGLTPWQDPHNDDPAYARVRVRRDVLPVLEKHLGPGIATSLARTARLLREDADALDALTPDLEPSPSCPELAKLAPAVRSRALKRWAERQGAGAVGATQVEALRALVEDWHGQGPVALSGGWRVARTDGRLACRRDG